MHVSETILLLTTDISYKSGAFVCKIWRKVEKPLRTGCSVVKYCQIIAAGVASCIRWYIALREIVMLKVEVDIAARFNVMLLPCMSSQTLLSKSKQANQSHRLFWVKVNKRIRATSRKQRFYGDWRWSKAGTFCSGSCILSADVVFSLSSRDWKRRFCKTDELLTNIFLSTYLSGI